MLNINRAVRKTVFWLACKLMLGLLFIAIMRASNSYVNAIAQKDALYFGTLNDANRAGREGRYDVALEQYARACSLARGNDSSARSDMARAYEGMAKTHERMGQTDYAIAEYKYAIDLQLSNGLSQTAWPHFQLGQLLFSQRKTAQARLEWQAAVTAARADPYPQVGVLQMRRQAEQLLARNPVK